VTSDEHVALLAHLTRFTMRAVGARSSVDLDVAR
jgi:hypothetical protein